MAAVEGLKLRGKTYWSDFYWGGQRIRKSLHTQDLATALERLRYIRAGLTGSDAPNRKDVSAENVQLPNVDLEAIQAPQAPDEGTSGFHELAEAYLEDLRMRTEKRTRSGAPSIKSASCCG